jgi:hypothetical protein
VSFVLDSDIRAGFGEFTRPASHASRTDETDRRQGVGSILLGVLDMGGWHGYFCLTFSVAFSLAPCGRVHGFDLRRDLAGELSL